MASSLPPAPGAAVSLEQTTRTMLLGARCSRTIFFCRSLSPKQHQQKQHHQQQHAPATTPCADLPSFLLERHIVAHPDLDADSRLALFRTSHALARMVLLHAPGSKRLTLRPSSSPWSATLTHLGTQWQPLPPLHLDLCIHGVAPAYPSLPPSPPPPSITLHTCRLELSLLRLTPKSLAAWQLHDIALWPHLEHLFVDRSFIDVEETTPLHQPSSSASNERQQLPSIPNLDSFRWLPEGIWSPEETATLLPLVQRARKAHLQSMAGVGDFNPTAILALLRGLPQASHVRLDGETPTLPILMALLQHPAAEHITLKRLADNMEWDYSQQPCRWKTLTVLQETFVPFLARLPLANLERLTLQGHVSAMDLAVEGLMLQPGMDLLQRLHASGRLEVLPDVSGSGLYSDQPFRFEAVDAVAKVCAPGHALPALVRLVVASGPSIRTLLIEPQGRWESESVQQVALALQESGLHVHTLCLHANTRCEGLLAALPASVTHVRVGRCHVGEVGLVKALVRDGAATVRRPLRLSLLHRSDVGEEVLGELRRLALGAGSVDGAFLAQQELDARGGEGAGGWAEGQQLQGGGEGAGGRVEVQQQLQGGGEGEGEVRLVQAGLRQLALGPGSVSGAGQGGQQQQQSFLQLELVCY